MCPPKYTFTNLNYDLVAVENISLDKNTRDELKMIAMRAVYEAFLDEFIINHDFMTEDNRYFNWYNGLTDISPVYFMINTYNNQVLRYDIKTMASNGSIHSKYFGEKYSRKFPLITQINGNISVISPEGSSAAISFKIEKNSFEIVQTGREQGREQMDNIQINDKPIIGSSYGTQLHGDNLTFIQERSLEEDEDIEDDLIDPDKMDGFQFSWSLTQTSNSSESRFNTVLRLLFMKYTSNHIL